MSSPDRDLLGVAHRQSPLAVGFLILRFIRGIGLVNIGLAILFVFNAPLPGGVFVTVPLVGLVLLGLGILAWWRFTFLVVEDELRVTKGILSVERLTVPLDRVQSVSVNQEFLHRLVGLVKVEVDTAGSAEAEFTIDAVDRSVADALQRLTAERVNVRTPADPDDDGPGQPPPPDVVLIRRTPAELVKIGLTQSPLAGLAVVGSLITFADDIGAAMGFDTDSIDRDTEFGSNVVLVVLGFLLVGLGLSMVFQVSREVVTHWNLTLTRTPTGLRRTAGLLSTTSKASSLPRVQRFETHQTPLRRLFGITSLKLPTIGKGDLYMPGCTPDELETVRRLVLEPDAQVQALDRRISPLAVFLAVRNTSVAAILGIVALWFAVGPWALLVALIVPPVWLAARRGNRLHRWGVSSGGVADHAELISATTREVALRKAQVVTVSQGIFEQRRKLATVKLVTAEGTVEVGMLPLAEAKQLRDHIIRVVETDHRQWM